VATIVAGVGDGEDDVEVRGSKGKQDRLVQAWAAIHRDELMLNWRRLLGGLEPSKIAPLL
jgi:hypothetical protein